MASKVQTVGINKDYLIKVHKELLTDMMLRGFKPSEEELQRISEMCVIQSKVFLFGLDELPEQKNDFIQSIVRRFPEGYKGINQYIHESANKRNYTYYTEFLLNILQNTERFITRSLEDIESPAQELAFLAIILAFEEYLEEYYQNVLLPRLVDIELEIKKQVQAIYNNPDLTEQEIVEQVDEYLDTKVSELNEQYANESDTTMFDEAVAKSTEAVSLLGLSLPNLSTVQKMISYGYLSNISAYFFNETRRIKESTYENIFSGANQRSLATEQIESIQFNKNVYSLSTITHARAMFRAVVDASAKDYTHFKALVFPTYFDRINPTGKSAQAVYQIKTREGWSDFVDNKNANVVGGLGLHHNDVVYYYPVVNNEESRELAKKQREQFLAQL